MPFGPEDSNLKLASSLSSETNCAIAAIQNIHLTGKEYAFSGDLLPSESDIRKGHLQGIAIKGSRAFVSASMKGGFIALFIGEGKNYSLVKLRSIKGYKHAGGIQTIGSFLIVPVESET